MSLEERGTNNKVRAVVQRVSEANVKVDGVVLGEIHQGFLVLLGVEVGDTLKDADYIVNKIAGLRVFCDENGKMNRSIIDEQGAILAISQFTLLGDGRHGNRPSFIQAEQPEKANAWYEYCCSAWQSKGIVVEKGEFGADMKVMLINDGPVTILLDSKKIL